MWEWCPADPALPTTDGAISGGTVRMWPWAVGIAKPSADGLIVAAPLEPLPRDEVEFDGDVTWGGPCDNCDSSSAALVSKA